MKQTKAVQNTRGALVLSRKGLDLIKEFEGLRLRAYRDPAFVYTIGYGHTGPGVYRGMVITEERADQMLRDDVAVKEQGVGILVTVPLTQSQFDALVSFSFNLGLGSLKRSALLRHLNAGEFARAGAQFPRWNKAGGKVLAGLTRRRLAEKKLFDGDAWGGGVCMAHHYRVLDA